MHVRIFSLVLFSAMLGASFSFADGMIGDADSIRARGGVGNYLFHRDYKDPGATDRTLERRQAHRGGYNYAPGDASDYENLPTSATFQEDELAISASSALPAEEAPKLGTILFPSSSARIASDDETQRLDTIAGYLKSDPSMKAQIVGYADATGEADANRKLSEARAKTVVEGLKRRGVSTAQLSWEAKGEQSPASDNSTAQGRAENRRVEVSFQ